MICDNIKIILERIERAKNKSGRRDAVKLVAVTKTVPVDRIREALGCGITDIGENRIREAEEKFEKLPDAGKIKKHLIGHLQTNKAVKAVRSFDLIQSVDSIRLLGEIDKRAQKIGKVQDCLVEIKVSEEETKSGLNPAELENFFEASLGLKNIKVSGLMTIAPYFENPESARPYFQRTYKYYSLFALRYSLSWLSMGMTNDFEVAVEEGANMVRIGTGIFGERLKGYE